MELLDDLFKKLKNVQKDSLIYGFKRGFFWPGIEFKFYAVKSGDNQLNFSLNLVIQPNGITGAGSRQLQVKVICIFSPALFYDCQTRSISWFVAPWGVKKDEYRAEKAKNHGRIYLERTYPSYLLTIIVFIAGSLTHGIMSFDYHRVNDRMILPAALYLDGHLFLLPSRRITGLPAWNITTCGTACGNTMALIRFRMSSCGICRHLPAAGSAGLHPGAQVGFYLCRHGYSYCISAGAVEARRQSARGSV